MAYMTYQGKRELATRILSAKAFYNGILKEFLKILEREYSHNFISSEILKRDELKSAIRKGIPAFDKLKEDLSKAKPFEGDDLIKDIKYAQKRIFVFREHLRSQMAELFLVTHDRRKLAEIIPDHGRKISEIYKVLKIRLHLEIKELGPLQEFIKKADSILIFFFELAVRATLRERMTKTVDSQDAKAMYISSLNFDILKIRSQFISKRQEFLKMFEEVELNFKNLILDGTDLRKMIKALTKDMKRYEKEGSVIKILVSLMPKSSKEIDELVTKVRT